MQTSACGVYAYAGVNQVKGRVRVRIRVRVRVACNPNSDSMCLYA